MLRYSNHSILCINMISSIQGYNGGHITETEVGDAIWKNFFHGKLTYMHRNNGQEMAPTISEEGGTLLVRKLPISDPT